MQVRKKLNVSIDEFYSFIKEMVLEDIKAATKKRVTVEDIQNGYQYKKELIGRTGQTGLVHAEILSLTPTQYSIQFKSAQGLNLVSYNYNKLDDSTIELIYEEDFMSDSKWNSLNFSVISFFYKRSSKKRILTMLNQIEQLITDKRKSA